ncbi:hypothetical protein ACFPOA_04580 [Lysobacter niabensis]|uniref:hypothetical protein n=1 Tax=Agrilutibacter niabensis TaxID=380628 RepID=UPI00360F9350
MALDKRPGRLRLLAHAIALLGVFAPAVASAERPYIAIEQRLTAQQIQATGLDQLNAEQLSLLNQLLREEQASVAVESAAAERERKVDAPVSSSLKGEFRGWQAGTVFELENGQRWRVVDGEYYTPTRLANPKVTVKPGLLGSWYIRIEGVSIGAKVRRVEDDAQGRSLTHI